ncbi:MAG TPA: sigma-70 family RNA polymerase sigma factor [Candidatus Angelobacter sp.]|nr:sigma-70 family RNA polymerase sigma factor [Candidatus Angelobacter sp.]
MTFVPAQMNIIASEGRLQIPQKEDTISCLIDLAMDWKAMPIQELLEHCRTGNEAALTELVKKISPVIHGVAYKSLRRYSINHGSIQNLVQDLTNDTFVKVLQALSGFKWQGDAQFFGWVKTITVNTVQDWLRKQKIEEPEDEALNTPEQGMSATERAQVKQIEEWLKGMGEARQDIDIFWFYYRYGYTAKEIGHMPEINLAEKRVETILARIIRKLRGKAGGAASGE